MPNSPSTIINHAPLENALAVPPSTELMSNEIKFLIACCQIDPSKNDIVFINTYLSQITNNKLLITAAIQHGILPLVYKTLKKVLQDSSSQSLITNSQSHDRLLSELKASYMSISQRNMLMSAELIRIIKLFKENDIRALAFKGPTLSQMAYGDITVRQYSDLDVLIKKEDIYKIETLLKVHGYKRSLTLTPIQESTRIKYAQDMGFFHPEKGILFEMHWSLLNLNYPIQVDLENFWEETQEIKLNSHTIPTFSNENLIIYLAIHGSKHLWERIEWIKDIDLLIQKKEINWEKLIEKVKGTGFENMVYLGLNLNVILFNTTLPESIHLEIKKCQPIEQLSDFVFESWVNSKNSFQTTHIQSKLLPSLKEKINYLHTRLLKPSLDEYLYVDLPKGLHWGYYLVKPYRLIKKHLFKS